MGATPHIIESALLLLGAFLLGCVIGYLIRRVRGNAVVANPAPVADAPAQGSEAQVSAQSVESTPAGKAPRASRSASVKGSSQIARKAAAEKPVPPVPAPTQRVDDLKKIRGVGPKLEAMLHQNGVHSYAQIAKWTRKMVAEMDAQLALRGRIEREDWVGQAKALNKAAK